MNLIIIPLVDSTNSYAMQLLENGLASEGTVVIAWEQTSGRGQRGSSWASQAGQGLYFSLILTPPAGSLAHVAVLVKALASGVSEYIHHCTGAMVEIKWPNDILVKERKVAGILLESVIKSDQLSAVVAGVGINLNQTEFEGDFARNPISMQQITGKQYNPEAEAAILYNFLMKSYLQFKAQDFPGIESEYHSHLFGLNKSCVWNKQGKELNAVFKGVNNRGEALLEFNDRIEAYSHPVVRLTGLT